MAPTKRSPFKKGRKAVSPSTGAKGGQFVTLKNDRETATLAPLVGLDELVSADMHSYWDVNPAVHHPCIGRKCPGCLNGNKAKFKAFLPVVTLPDNEVKIWSFPITVFRQLEALEDAQDDESLKGKAIRLTRHGTGIKTNWVVMGTGKEIDVDGFEVPDFVPNLGPSTEADIIAALDGAGIEVASSTAGTGGGDTWGDDL